MRTVVLGGYTGVVVTTGATVERVTREKTCYSILSFGYIWIACAQLWSRITATTHRIVASVWN